MSEFISYGIDLGTTNSCIAKFDSDSVQIYQNNDQMNVTPSVVRIEKSGRVIVGRRAYATRLENPENVAFEFKRWMGQKDKAQFASSGKALSAEELSAEVLKSLLEDARKQTGDPIRASVITVPAAFGQLQCEATARAASLAGLLNSPLLQEPIAAAVAYGLAPDVKDQRWLVFDLGGGTLDIAVVSSKDGRLSVLEHRGNNLLGGKDIDRLLVDEILFPQLRKEFNIPASVANSAENKKLAQRLQLRAEEAKIDLSRDDSVVVSLFDLGTDLDGNEIEAELTITRAELERLCEPVFEKAIGLCQEALEGARISKKDLDRVLLVGGPTQMPLLREMLADRLTSNVDYSQDPMTVVARGAAIYAASLEVDSKSVNTPSEVKADSLKVKLAYESISSDIQCPVGGKIEGEDVVELKIDGEGGHWTSGWFKSDDGFFEIDVNLLPGKTSKFVISARRENGESIDIEPAKFAIRHGLTVAAPPLPHSISAEVVSSTGKPELDQIFSRNTSLPCQITKVYAASKTLRPSETDTLAIKLWEGEVVSDPSSNNWVGSLQISNEEIKRALPEGSEIEVTVSINISRLMTVEAYVPRLDAYFVSNVYVPQRDEQSFVEIAQLVPEQIENYLERIEVLEDAALLKDSAQLESNIDVLKRKLEDLDIQMGAKAVDPGIDPDQAKRLVEESRLLRSELLNMEASIEESSEKSDLTDEAKSELDFATEVVTEYGDDSEKKELKNVASELELAISKADSRTIKRATKVLNELRYRILFKQDGFWLSIFADLKESDDYVDERRAKELIEAGFKAFQNDDMTTLKSVVRDLMHLIPQDKVKEVQAKSFAAGIRRI